MVGDLGFGDGGGAGVVVEAACSSAGCVGGRCPKHVILESSDSLYSRYASRMCDAGSSYVKRLF